MLESELTTQLTFLTTLVPQTAILPGYLSQDYVVNVVTDIVLPTKEILHFNHHSYDLQPTREATISLQTDMATRVIDFCKTYYVEGLTGFDCHTFIRYIMGWTSTPQYGKVTYVTQYHPVAIDATKPHKAYMIRSEQNGLGRIEHTMLGTEHSGYCLGVLTENAPLVFARNTEMMRIFQGKWLLEVA